jgi:hypothetical protein
MLSRRSLSLDIPGKFFVFACEIYINFFVIFF